MLWFGWWNLFRWSQLLGELFLSDQSSVFISAMIWLHKVFALVEFWVTFVSMGWGFVSGCFWLPFCILLAFLFGSAGYSCLLLKLNKHVEWGWFFGVVIYSTWFWCCLLWLWYKLGCKLLTNVQHNSQVDGWNMACCHFWGIHIHLLVWTFGIGGCIW